MTQVRSLRAIAVLVLIALAPYPTPTGSLAAAPRSRAGNPALADAEAALMNLDMEIPIPHIPKGVTPARARVSIADDSGPAALVYHAARRPLDVPHSPQPRMYRTGFGAGEPTMGVTKDGAIFIQHLAGSPLVALTQDGGKTWKDVSPELNGRKRHPESLDPFLYVDYDTGRVYTYDFLFGCSEISFSDDLGKTWTTSTLNCAEMDHQNLFSADPVNSPTVGYPKIVYTCSTQAGATIYSVTTMCEKSLDGGLSWTPTGTPPFTTDRQEENDLGVEGYCHGAVGHGFGGPDGTIYVPKGLCGQPWLAISKDEGATWSRVQVSDLGMPQTTIGVYEHEASVAADEDGNIYYFWIANDRLPYLAISRDAGETFEKPMMIGPPGLKESSLPSLTLGAEGKVAIAYYGSTNSPGKPFPQSDDCKPDPVYCFSQLFFLNPEDPKKYEDVTWNGYMTVSDDVLSKNPTFYTASVNDPSDPFVRGTCGPIRCKAVYDFIDVVIDKAGRAWGAYVDVCITTCAKKGPNNQGNEGVLATLKGGPSLR